MNDITEFLLARIAEDEERASHAKWAMQGEWFTTADDKIDEYVQGLPPARVLAECEAKRRIVENYRNLEPHAVSDDATTEIVWHAQGLYEAMLDLAQVHADHPDFSEEWRPESDEVDGR